MSLEYCSLRMLYRWLPYLVSRSREQPETLATMILTVGEVAFSMCYGPDAMALLW
jgi:hypothetical protein